MSALDIVIIVLIMEPIASVAANVLLWRWYFGPDGNSRSWVVWMLAVASTVINVAFIIIGFIAGRRLIGLEPLTEGALITALTLVTIGGIPIFFVIVYGHRRFDWLGSGHTKHK